MKVVIDAFDTEEQAVAFIDWFKKKCDRFECQIITAADGKCKIDWDDMDLDGSNKDQFVINIVVDSSDDSGD